MRDKSANVCEPIQIEKVLISEQENFRNSLDMSPFGIEIIKLSGELLYVNRKMLEIWDYESLEELKKVPVSQRFVPDSVRTIKALKKQSEQGHIPPQCDMSIIRKDGQIRDLHAYTGFVVWNDERCAQVFFEDITERNRAEKRLDEEQSNFFQSIEKSPFGIEIIKIDGELVYLNPAMLAFWGYDNIEEVKAIPREKRFSPETITLINKANKKNLKGVIPSQQELTIIRKNGSLKKLLGYDFEILWNGERRIQVIYEDITEKKSTEMALRKEQENFRKSIESSPLGIQIIDTNGNMIYANRALVDIWGYSSYEELMKTPRTRRFAPVSLKKISNLRRRRLQGRILPKHEITIVRKDGQLKILHGYNTEILWNGIWCSEIIYEDVTEQRQTEEKLRVEQENFRNSIEMSPLGITIIRFDGELVYTNKAMLELWGYDSFVELKNTPREQRLTPESENLIVEVNEKRLKRNAPAQYDITIICKNGQLKNLRAYNKEIMWNGELCAQVLHEDVTLQRQIEEKLKKEQENFRNSLEMSPLGIQIVSNNGEIVYANPVMLGFWGYGSIEELKKVPFEQRFTPESVERIIDINRNSDENNVIPQYDVAIISKDGRLKNLHAYNKEVIWNSEKCGQILYEDVTERRRVDEQLRQEQENFRNSIELSPLGIQVINFKGELVYTNRTMLDFWGYSSFEELKNIPSNARFTSSSLELINKLNEMRRLGKIPPDHDLTIICKDGKPKDLHAYNKEILWNGEQCALILHEDVTGKRQIEERLRKEQENYRNLIEKSPFGIQIVRSGIELVYANRTMLDIWGYDSFTELKDTPREKRYTEESLATVADINKEYRQGKITTQRDVTIIRKDGQLRKLHGHHIDIVWDGETCAETVFEDVTEIRQTEENLKKEQENFRNSIEMSPLGIQIVNVNGILTWANKTMLEMWGYTSVNELVNIPIEQRFTPESITTIKRRISEYTIGNIETYEITAIRKNGEHRHWLAYPKDIIWDGHPYIQTIYQDVTERDKVEAALRFSNAAFQSIHEAVWATDNNLIVTHWNAISEKIFGIKANDAIGKHISEVVTLAESYPGHNKQRVDELVMKQYVQEEQSYLTYKGPVWLDVHSQIIEAEGNRFGWVTLAEDITERKRVEEALLFKNTLLEAQAENTIEGIRVNDENMKIVFTNKRFREMWQIPQESVESEDGALATDYMVSMTKDPENVRRRLYEIYNSQSVKSQDILELTDGRTFDRYSAPMIDKNGNYRGRVWYYRDVTEPRRMRVQLEQAAEEWRSTFDSITDRISIHDKENRLIRVNKAFAQYYGIKPQEVVGKTCDKLPHNIACIPERCPWRQVMQTGEPYSVEHYLAESGTWVQESGSPLFGNNGELIGTVNIAKDVTQFKQMEQKLIMSDRLASIGELVSGIAHELNNPLTGVIGFSQLLLEKDVADDIKEDLAVISSESQRAARIVKNLLTFARKHTPVKQPSNMNTIIDDVLKLREYEQKVNNIEVIKRFDANIPEIMMDNFQMQQVILNIIINAEYFMMESHNRGTINIVTEKLDDLMRITISDDGPGIPPENLGRIFDPFYTTKEVGKGTGLGLSICHGIIIEHGGYMYAKSEPGQGASFVIEFPLERS